MGEWALRALTKLDQVMPSRLRSQVSAVHEATVTLTSPSDEPVAPEVLMTLARACRDRGHVAAGYVDIRGNATRRRHEEREKCWQTMATAARNRGDHRTRRSDACVVTTGADDPERMVSYFAAVGCDFEVLEPPELSRAVAEVSARLQRATVNR